MTYAPNWNIGQDCCFELRFVLMSLFCLCVVFRFRVRVLRFVLFLLCNRVCVVSLLLCFCVLFCLCYPGWLWIHFKCFVSCCLGVFVCFVLKFFVGVSVHFRMFVSFL